ncbi:uncharacterized protein LOC130902096 [Diorhabda carinulata]|uniref:uncharacterized protein LOC130902096 n=1 Tax=Diorhabda carinulata TaxID=1163345 RepID=UPI0025A108C3|nr:uncharacterized protein LOC130902096 [Diorhabda carinulata]
MGSSQSKEEVIKAQSEIKQILETRSINITSNSNLVETAEMAEEFSLRTAANLLPSVDDTENTTKQLINAIELYDAQADGDGGAVKILRVANEKIAINTFANGLRNHELRTVIKARNYAKLKDAISGAKDEEISKKASSSSQVFHTRNKSDSRQNNAYRGNSRSNGNNRGSYRNNSNHTNRNNNYNSRNSNYNNQNNRQRDNNNFRGRNNGRYNNRNQRSGNNRYNQNNNNQRCNVIGSGENRENGSTNSGATVSIIFASHLSDNQYIDSSEKIKINGIAGSTYAKGKTNITFLLGNTKVSHDFHVVDECGSDMHGVLGADFLLKHAAIIDYEKYLFLFWNKGEKISIPLDSKFNYCTTIPPRCEIIKHFLVDNNDDSVIVSQEICKGVYAAGLIVRPVKNMIPIQLQDGATPVYVKPYRLPHAQKAEIHKQIDKMLADGIVEKSKSSWNSALLLVPKKADSNDSLGGAMYFSHLDLAQGYHQIELDSESRQYTAFTTDRGQYQLTRLPMGLKISPSAFARAMTIAMSGLNYESHVISANGISPDPEKIRVMQQYPVPKDANETKRFVAFANYYRKFIKNFAEIAAPLNHLSKKRVKFSWNDECQKAFETLKNVLINPPILQYPDFSENNHFIIRTDASGKALGAVLSNANGMPVAYASRTLNKSEKNYCTVELELLSIVWSVKKVQTISVW